MRLNEYVRAARKYWWIVLVVLSISLAAGVLVTVETTKQYATTITFFVRTPSDQLSTAAQGDTFGQKRVNSYAQLASTDRLLRPVLNDTKLTMSISDLAAEVKASGDLNTVLLTVTVTDPNPTRSLVIGTAISTEFVKLVTDLESTAGSSDSTVRLELVSGPNLTMAPVSPRPRLNIGIAGLIGLVVGLSLAVLKELLDTTVRSASQLERAASSVIIGIIPFDETAKKKPLIIEGDSKSLRAEAFRQLRTNLEFIDVDSPAKIIIVTSSVSEEGKSSTAANLAVIFAEAGKSVLLVEGDLRRPRVADYLGLEGSVGLTNVLAGQVDVTEVLQPWGRGGLTVLPSGSVPPNPSELLGSRNMSKLLVAMATKFDIVLIDTPPLLPVTDGAVLAARADGAILVVRHGSTSRQQVAIAAKALQSVDGKLLGCVLNMALVRGADAYAYGYGYGNTYRRYDDQSSRPALTLEESKANITRTEAEAGLSQPNGHRAAL